MNALTVLSIAAVAACSSAQIIGFPGLFPGLLPQGYTGFHPGAAPITYKTVAPAPVGVAPAPVAPLTYKVAPVAPLTYNVAPVAPLTYNVAPLASVQSQYHAQDELGQYSFGYSGGPSSRAETRDAFGIVRGSYNYVDADGKIQTQHYVADALGFRVSGTNLPVAPDAPVAAPLIAPVALPGPLPEAVQDTPEVAAAKAAFKTAYDEAAAAAAAAPDTRK